MTGVHHILKDYAARVTSELEKIFDTPLDEWLGGVVPSGHANDAWAHLREYTLRPSKRVRGALAAFSYDQAADTKFGASGLLTGAAIELAQSYWLIIDDIMDRSALRRGKPSVHELYRQQIADKHTADMAALCVGLMAGHLVNLIIGLADEPPERIAKTSQIIHKNLMITGLGQLDDLYQHMNKAGSEQQIISKYHFKTSYYTFVNPVQAGMVMGGIDSPKKLREVVGVGLPAGVAFQLHDDILGVYGESSNTGKLGSDDIEEGKHTVLLHYTLQHATGADKKILQRVVGKSPITTLELNEAKRIMDISGAHEFVNKMAKQYAQEAKRELADSSFWSEQAKSVIRELIDYSVTRER